MESSRIYAVIDYEDPYVEPLLLSAIRARLQPEVLVLIKDVSELPAPSSKLLQWRQYESIDFEHLMDHADSSVANSLIIRKALIRKHYLSATVEHWSTKNPTTLLREHIKPSVAFEVDFAEFLDDALLEAYELKESWARNDDAVANHVPKEWWILKPGMSERGQGIRLFSSEEELQGIFDEWDPPSEDEDEEDPDRRPSSSENNAEANGIITSQLRHFVAQPYVDPPLLLTEPHPSSGRKFHIRTYVVAVGALKVYVYKPMLALFAGHQYTSPSESSSANENLASHLTNTCLQSGEREGSVHAFWSLPETIPELQQRDWRHTVFQQICSVTGEVFEAAARSMSIHFQPLPNAFEIFGLDFLVDASGTAWLLEVNAFPDFAQTGGELQGLIRGLFEEAVDVAILPFFAAEPTSASSKPSELVQVLDVDLGRR